MSVDAAMAIVGWLGLAALAYFFLFPGFAMRLSSKTLEVGGLWAATIVGLIAVFTSSYDAREQLGVLKDENRSWVAPTTGYISDIIENNPIHFTIRYYNSGKRPAPVYIFGRAESYSLEQWNSGHAWESIDLFKDKCFKYSKLPEVHQVLYPTGASDFSRFDFTTFDHKIGQEDAILVDKDIIEGKKYVAQLTCFVYDTFGEVRHSVSCNFYDARSDNSRTSIKGAYLLSVCRNGNYAD